MSPLTFFEPASGNESPSPRRSAPFGGAPFLLAVAGALLACDIPTDAPQLEQRWVLPGDDTSVGVEEILPDRVSLTPNGSAFAVEADPVSFHESLGSLCSPCTPLDGQTVPKPAFQGTFSETISLPDEVESAQVEEGTVRVTAHNGLSFDPLRPPGDATGTATLTLRDGGPGGRVLNELVLDGADTSFGPGATLARSLTYSGPITPHLVVTVSVSSPAGGLQPPDWVHLSLTDDLQVTATPETLEVASAVVAVAGRAFNLEGTSLDVGDLDQSLVDRVTSGAFDLEISNPWALGATVTLTISGPTLPGPIIKLANVPAQPTSTVRVEFTASELQAFLGEPNVTLSGTGTVANDAVPVTISPSQRLAVSARFDLILLVG